jgi:hypothetical protein
MSMETNDKIEPLLGSYMVLHGRGEAFEGLSYYIQISRATIKTQIRQKGVFTKLHCCFILQHLVSQCSEEKIQSMNMHAHTICLSLRLNALSACFCERPDIKSKYSHNACTSLDVYI